MFSYKRFFEQFKMIWMQNRQRTFLNFGIIALIIAYQAFRLFYLDNSFSLDSIGFIVGLLCIFISSSAFSALQQTSSGIHYYMTPASIGEKYGAAWFYSSLFTIVIYSAFILLMYILMMSLGNVISGKNLPLVFPEINWIKNGFLALMFYQSFFFLGSAVFKKNALGKTLLSMLVLAVGMGLLISAILSWYVGGFEQLAVQQVNITINSIDDLNQLGIPATYETWAKIGTIVLTAIPFICWIAAYFRLKTREV